MKPNYDFSWVHQEYGYQIKVPEIWENLAKCEHKGTDGVERTYVRLFSKCNDHIFITELVVALVLYYGHYQGVDDELSKCFKQWAKVADQFAYDALVDVPGQLDNYFKTVSEFYPFDQMHDYDYENKES